MGVATLAAAQPGKLIETFQILILLQNIICQFRILGQLQQAFDALKS